MYDKDVDYFEMILESLKKLSNKQLYVIYNFIKTFNKKEAG